MGSHVLGCAQLDEQDWLHGYTDTIPNGNDGEEEGASPKKRRRRASSAGGMPGGVVAAGAQDRSLVLCSVIDQTDIDQQLPPAFDRKHFYR
ncbi:cirrhosis, autosomal recessive 1A (cirhin), partial [Perkinsus olseni]